MVLLAATTLEKDQYIDGTLGIECTLPAAVSF